MNPQFTTPEKPTLVNAIAWMTLASGIVNVIWGLVASGTALATFIGVICTPLTILPTVLGIFEIIYAAKLLSNPPQPVQPSTPLAVLEIVSVIAGNIFSMVVGILALVFYNDITVKDYFARLNGTIVPPAPVAPVVPASTSDPEPGPASPEEMPPVKEPPLSNDEPPQG